MCIVDLAYHVAILISTNMSSISKRQESNIRLFRLYHNLNPDEFKRHPNLRVSGDWDDQLISYLIGEAGAPMRCSLFLF